MNPAYNGAVGTAGVFDGDMNVGANMTVGNSSTGLEALFGTLRNVKLYQQTLAAARLQELTT